LNQEYVNEIDDPIMQHKLKTLARYAKDPKDPKNLEMIKLMAKTAIEQKIDKQIANLYEMMQEKPDKFEE
jgi:CobQ-like glutamine amidotransferase family enzyme